MTKINIDMVLLQHKLIAEQTGGDPEVRDLGLLDAALQVPFQTFDGIELYPTKHEKAARLGYSLISNHPFVDGNKRIGMHIMISFLELNGLHCTADVSEVVRVGFAVASGEMNYNDLLDWVKTNAK